VELGDLHPNFVLSLDIRFILKQIGALDRVEGELQAFDDLLKKNPKFAAFIANPTISRSDKAAKVKKFLCLPSKTLTLRSLICILFTFTNYRFFT